MSGRVEKPIEEQRSEVQALIPEDSGKGKTEDLRHQLDWMLQLSQSINFNFSRKTLLDSYDYVLHEGMGLNQYALLLKEDQWSLSGRGIDEELFQKEGFHRLDNYYSIDELSGEDASRFGNLKLVIPIIHKSEPLAYLLLSNPDWEKSKERNNLEYLQAITNIIAIGFENKRLFKSAMQQELIKHDLDLARRMQEMLVQDELPDRPELRLASIYIPDRQVGGDYFDCQQTGEHEWYFCVADVSGKGIAASLLMANFQANLRSLLLEGGDLKHIISVLNRRFFKYTKGDGFITLFLAKLNSETGVLDYVNAGHVPPILCLSNSAERLKGGCTLIGAFPELPSLKVQRKLLEEECLILTFTDGVNEITNFKKEELGTQGLQDFALSNFEMPIEDFNDALLNHLRSFKGSEDFEDDVTILSLRYRPNHL